MRRAVVLLTAAGVLVAMLVLAGVAATAQPPVPTELHAFMTGEQVTIQCLIAPCADPNGRGVAVVKVYNVRLCYTLDVERIKPATAAHIHRGVRGENVSKAVTLKAPTNGSSKGCKAISPPLSFELREHPGRYYVDVHNRPFPAGAVRGQLHR